MNTRFRWITVSLACCASLAAPRLQAESSSTNKAAAEALFNEGVALVAAGKFSQGCDKFEGSQSFDPTLGTTLRLADCYERAGKTASAWALFKQGEGQAHRQGEADREAIARQRAEALLARLSYLTVQRDSSAPADLTVTLNGAPLPLVSLGAAIPVDPGQQDVTASAPGYESWSGHVDVSAGSRTVTTTIPPLKTATKPEPAERTDRSLGAHVVANERPAQEPRTQRNAGIAVASLGVAGVLVGAGLGYYAKHENDRSRLDSYCPLDNHTGCTSAGLALRERAQSFAGAATVTMIAGGALLAGGLVLWSTAPEAKQASQNVVHLSAVALPGGFRTELGGSW